MIVTEHGLHFVRDGEHWRCVEHPDFVMLRGDHYQVEGQYRAARAGLSD